MAVQAVTAPSPRIEFLLLASGNVRIRVEDTNLGIQWAMDMSAANWALLVAMSGTNSYMQFTLTSGGAMAPQAAA